MKPLILLIHTQAHVAALPETAKTIIAAGFDRCWVIISPAIAVDTSAAAEKLDSEITALRTAERAAAERADYDAANGHKIAREGKMLDRDKAIADAWKSVPEEDRKLAYRSKLAPLFEAFQGKVNARMNATQEHYAAAQWIQMLNSLSGVWPKELVHGEYVVAWPGALPDIQLGKIDTGTQEGFVVETTLQSKLETDGTKKFQWKDSLGHDRSPVFTSETEALSYFGPATLKVEKVSAAERTVLPDRQTKSRGDELACMKHFSLVGVAKKLGIETEGKIKSVLIEEIVKAEISGVPTPDLATY